MTAPTIALQELLAKVDAGRWSTIRDEPSAETGLLIYWEQFDLIMSEGSLDAAMELHEAVFPGWWFQVMRGSAEIRKTHREVYFSEVYDQPARAWLCAILKALIAECDE